ncbi:pro-sigmaK processing inhibitor BofA family protein [Sporosarcina sp. YIM B06819]|uniref:pro-sigmaK processing inhibitor BofA family protein n=1 Tax=Sporosarcina sp. YIM B06819 TaxID=3081769 RepID=UPI00298C0284|nr:pro-sigmaK processing inhibitor BofA family protein [Sporosarcina sp. YIM B06819]
MFSRDRIEWIIHLKGAFPVKVIGIVVVGLVLLLLMVMDKTQIQKVLERLSVYWFRLAFAFLVLFAMNIAGGFIGVYVPVNIMSGLVLAVLGIPGMAALCAFAILL